MMHDSTSYLKNKFTRSTCNCHWVGERASLLVLQRACFREAKLFTCSEIWKQESWGGVWLDVKPDGAAAGSYRREPFLTWVTFFGSLIFRVGSLPADAFVRMGLTQYIGNWHQGDSLALLWTHKQTCLKFWSLFILLKLTVAASEIRVILSLPWDIWRED